MTYTTSNLMFRTIWYLDTILYSGDEIIVSNLMFSCTVYNANIIFTLAVESG